MSGYQPQKGDRVRVVLEGEVTYSRHDVRFDLAGLNTINPAAEHVVSVEKVAPPLPTTPGSVIHWLGSFVHLSKEGRWVDDNGDSIHGPGVDSFHLHGFEVIFDAGEVTP
jgi:hypothetical protein